MVHRPPRLVRSDDDPVSSDPTIYEIAIPIDLDRLDDLLDWLKAKTTPESLRTIERRDHPRKAHAKQFVLTFTAKKAAALAKKFWA